MQSSDEQRRVGVVDHYSLFQGDIRVQGGAGAASRLSLIDLLSNPVKTQEPGSMAAVAKDLLSLSRVVVERLDRQEHETFAGMLIPKRAILFAFESQPGDFVGDRDFKMQSRLEQGSRQYVKIGLGPYTMKGWSVNFFNRYAKEKVDFLALSDVETDFVMGNGSPEAVQRFEFCAVNKRQINSIVVLA